MFPSWNLTLIAVSASFHSVAILSTLFRLWYRWHTARMWWDDAWAVLALLADIAWLVVAVKEQPNPRSLLPHFFKVGNWIISFAYPTLMWATRISILASVVRVSRPEGALWRVALGVGTLFGIMGAAMVAQRLQICITRACLMTRTVLITQTTTDCLADALLSALPIWFLSSMKLDRIPKIMICSALSASMVINIVTIIEVVVLFRSITSGSVVFEHVKVACSLIVCNLLVITGFVYRLLHKGKSGFEDSIPRTGQVIEFTTVDLAMGGFSQETSKGTALSRITKSSTWSYKNSSRSGALGSVTPAMSRVDALSMPEKCTRGLPSQNQ